MQIQQNISLKNYNTLWVDAKAKFFVVIKNEDEILELIQNKIRKENKRLVLWWWANTLFKSDFDGLIVKNEIMWKEIIDETGKKILLQVWAGEDRPEFVNRCVSHNYGWIENLALIPWCVWAAPIGNIWAYWVEVKDIIHQVRWINIDTGELQIFDNSECQFGYRDSIFKNQYKDKILVTHVIWDLTKANTDYIFNIDYADIKRKIDQGNINIAKLTVKDVADMIAEIRNGKLPDYKNIWTAGSFFKNPVVSKQNFEQLKTRYDNLLWFDFEWEIKLSAWQLIEMAGFKWVKENKVGTYQYHALVIINQWWSGQDIINFASKIQSKVKEMFGVSLDPEVNYV